MKQSAADQIWNRAVQEGPGPSSGPGDRALASLLYLHGLAMNGGVHHAMDMLNAEELSAAIDGYSYFGFKDLADWLKNAATDPLLKEWTDETETPAILRYAEYIPDDAYLTARFEAVYCDKPSDFAAC